MPSGPDFFINARMEDKDISHGRYGPFHHELLGGPGIAESELFRKRVHRRRHSR